MDLQIRDKLFFVSGATSGFGKSVTLALIKEGARVLLNARGEERLRDIKSAYPGQVDYVAGDITTTPVMEAVFKKLEDKTLDGMLVNAGGPPAMGFLESKMEDWDEAYKQVLRWKVFITNALLPKFRNQKYGRIVYIESVSVKQPVENLVLSNSLRLAVVGFVKTLSQEVAKEGINLNIIAPGYHATPAMDRLFIKRSMLLGITPEEAQTEFAKEVQMGMLGDPDDLASLASWLLSPHSRYITGQTIAVDGGLYQGI